MPFLAILSQFLSPGMAKNILCRHLTNPVLQSCSWNPHPAAVVNILYVGHVGSFFFLSDNSSIFNLFLRY